MGNLQFQVWDAADAHDRRMWIECWEQWPGREVFAHPDYLLSYAGPRVRALCAAGSIDGSNVLYPFLLRALKGEAYCCSSLHNCVDITSPYGYGGPFAWGATCKLETGTAFWREFDAWATESHVVSEVVKLSLFPETQIPYIGDTRVVSDNVVRSLAISADEMWREFEPKVRKNVNRARTSGVTIQFDDRGERQDEFLRIYTGTMDRRNARRTYYFPPDYFE